MVVKKDATMTTKDRDSTSAVKTTVFLGVINFWYDVEGRLSVNHIVRATSESYQVNNYEAMQILTLWASV